MPIQLYITILEKDSDQCRANAGLMQGDWLETLTMMAATVLIMSKSDMTLNFIMTN